MAASPAFVVSEFADITKGDAKENRQVVRVAFDPF